MKEATRSLADAIMVSLAPAVVEVANTITGMINPSLPAKRKGLLGGTLDLMASVAGAGVGTKFSTSERGGNSWRRMYLEMNRAYQDFRRSLMPTLNTAVGSVEERQRQRDLMRGTFRALMPEGMGATAGGIGPGLGNALTSGIQALAGFASREMAA